jgi:hypothetical protein
VRTLGEDGWWLQPPEDGGALLYLEDKAAQGRDKVAAFDLVRGRATEPA